MVKCYCGSQFDFETCCKPFINGDQEAPTAEALMRSRYSAFATHNADYLVQTNHISTRKSHKKEDILDWAQSNQWIKLEVLNASTSSVEFKAFYLDGDMKMQVHHEYSTFKLEAGKWFYVDGSFH